jgi:ubiquinone/menaquinone biosynthesis C-methylase UbiE
MFGEASFDAALMLGPLLHLVEKSERLLALAEMKRILVPGGVGVLQYLNSWGLLRTGLIDFPEWYDQSARVSSMLDAQSFEGTMKGFTDCHWSTPPDALAEVEESGLKTITYAGAESFLSGMPGLIERMKAENPTRYSNTMGLAATMAELPQYRDATDHLSIVTQKAT